MAAGACFATRSDVRLLQDDIGRLQASAARAAHADTLQAQQLQQIVRALGAVSDSLRLATLSLQRFQGDVSMSMHGVESQLLTIQELTGQSRKQLDAMRAQIEARANEAPAPVAAAPGAPSVPGAAPAAGQAAPGPYQLMELGTQQLKKGAASAARAAFSDLITQYPGSDLVPEAQYKIAEAFTSAGSAVEADSVYALVAERYPASEYAPNAIYKRALALKVAGQTRQARSLLQQVLDKYPKSDAAILAASLIRDLK
jgi:tol-pal system protein YbgF